VSKINATTYCRPRMFHEGKCEILTGSVIGADSRKHRGLALLSSAPPSPPSLCAKLVRLYRVLGAQRRCTQYVVGLQASPDKGLACMRSCEARPCSFGSGEVRGLCHPTVEPVIIARSIIRTPSGRIWIPFNINIFCQIMDPFHGTVMKRPKEPKLVVSSNTLYTSST
jgi:hypothetical protein